MAILIGSTHSVPGSFNVKSYGAVGSGLVNDATAIGNAITAAAGSTVHFPPGTYRIDSAITFPITVGMSMSVGAVIVKSAVGTIAINGPFEAPKSQVFSGFSPGNVTFGLQSVNEICPEWFGAKADDATNCESAIRQSIGALAVGGKINFGRGLYYVPLTAVTVPGAPTVALAGAGSGNLNNGDYYYRITYVTAYGETSRGTASASVTVVDKTSNGQVALTDIPVSGDARVTARRIYRCSVNDGDEYTKLVTTISNNIDTTYTDNKADADLGNPAPTTNSSACISISVANTTIKGADGTSQIHFDVAPGTVCFDANATSLHIHDITLAGGGTALRFANSSAPFNHLVEKCFFKQGAASLVVTDTYGVKIRDCKFYLGVGGGVSLLIDGIAGEVAAVTTVTVENCLFDESGIGRYAIQILGHCSGTKISSCIISGKTQLKAYKNGAYPSATRIENCHFEDASLTHAVELIQATEATLPVGNFECPTNTVIRECTFGGFSVCGVSIDGAVGISIVDSYAPISGPVYAVTGSVEGLEFRSQTKYITGVAFTQGINRFVGTTTEPTIGTYEVGDIVFNSAPAAAGFIGWVCTVAGSPGTWKGFGEIEA